LMHMDCHEGLNLASFKLVKILKAEIDKFILDLLDFLTLLSQLGWSLLVALL
jgi:hypothetical protein